MATRDVTGSNELWNKHLRTNESVDFMNFNTL